MTKAPAKIIYLFIFAGSLSLLLWRLMDFLEEVLQGNLKMSMDQYHAYGLWAGLLQLAIIAVLLVLLRDSSLRLLRAIGRR